MKLDLSKLDAGALFSGLLKPEQKESTLSLPNSYEILLKQIQSLITSLMFFKRRRQVSSFAKIRESIQEETKHSFTYQTLGRAIRALPNNSIGAKWQGDARKKAQFTMHIYLISDPDLDVWIAYSHDFLLNTVKTHHEVFLKKINSKHPNVYNCWHSDFKLNELPEIEPIEFAVPEKDTSQRDLLSSMTFQNDTDDSVSAVVHNPDQESQLEKIPKSCQGLRAYAPVLKLVQAKETFVATASEVAKARKNDLILELADLLNTYFQRANKGTQPFKQVFSVVKSSKNFKMMKEEEINEYMANVFEMSNGFFMKCNISSNDYIKCNKSVSYNQLRSSLFNALTV